MLQGPQNHPAQPSPHQTGRLAQRGFVTNLQSHAELEGGLWVLPKFSSIQFNRSCSLSSGSSWEEDTNKANKQNKAENAALWIIQGAGFSLALKMAWKLQECGSLGTGPGRGIYAKLLHNYYSVRLDNCYGTSEPPSKNDINIKWVVFVSPWSFCSIKLPAQTWDPELKKKKNLQKVQDRRGKRKR